MSVQELPASPVQLDSLYDIVTSGGPLMWPILLASVIALTYIVERAIRF